MVWFGASTWPAPPPTPVLRAPSHLHASAVHLDHLGTQGLDATQDDLLVLCQRDPQAQDISAKHTHRQPQGTSPNCGVLC